MARLLMVEDDDRIAGMLLAGLQVAGHDVVRASTAAQALAAADADVDLVLLDLGLPDMDGFALCRQLRQVQPSAVIVVLTAKVDEMDVVEGLESGADDYLTKPFRMTELQARVRAHLRRSSSDEQTSGASGVRVGALHMDFLARRVWLGDDELTLRAKEFDLLGRLASDAGTALRRETLMADVWDENWFGSTKTLDVHVATLRRKLEESAARQAVEPPLIQTLRGHGYRLEGSPEPVLQAP